MPIRSSLSIDRFTVLGESLAAGYGRFGIDWDSQRWSFPAQIAAQLGADLPQPLLEPPGIGYAPGFNSQPVLLPGALQSTVFERLPPDLPGNLAFPGCTLSAAVERTATEPLIQRDSAVLTAQNLVTAARKIALGERPLPTPVDAAAARHPGLLIVELGFAEALEAAVSGNGQAMPTADRFAGLADRLLSAFPDSSVVLMNVPDPFDTAHFFSLDDAAATVRSDGEWIAAHYGIRDPWLCLPAVHAIAGHLMAGETADLPSGSTVSETAARLIRSRISEWNQQLCRVAQQRGALYFDLHSLYTAARRGSMRLAGRVVNGQYLGGIFGLSGYYPGATGQAVIANAVIEALNRATGTRFPLVRLDDVAKCDAVMRYRPAAGHMRTLPELQRLARSARLAKVPDPPQSRQASQPAPLNPIFNLSQLPLPLPLRLPPGLEQVLPLNPAASYFGDGISALHCEDPADAVFGSRASHLFGGLAMVDSHLHGQIRIRFSPLVDGCAKFEISLEGGLEGEDATLAAPLLFQMPFQRNRVEDVPGRISTGVLNLENGVVTQLRVYAQYRSQALAALAAVNPGFPRDPLSFVSLDHQDQQREYGSAWASFSQRPDGLLDFTFYGSRFVPLGPNTVWPLNFSGPDGDFATVPADGTVMHPHLRLSTAPVDRPTGATCPPIPFNSVVELTYHSRNSAFGDAFLLNVPDLGGVAKGRSHVMGRLQVQFGLPSGGTVPVAVVSLGPGGHFTAAEPSPISANFPGRLTPGPTGFYEMLRFPLRTYALDELSILDDPFDPALAAIDLASGHIFEEHLHRGFIQQDLIYALMRIEPRTPKNSFFFRGPAVLESGADGALRFRYRGEVHILYPGKFRFPQPNLSTAYINPADAALEPFLWIHAVQDLPPRGFVMEGERRQVLASIGETFSCRYRICDPSQGPSFFEYENHFQNATFRLHSLSWIGFGNSMSAKEAGECDTVTFCGFGRWQYGSHRSLQLACVQICNNPSAPYIGVQIDSGDVSNVHTKPKEERDALP